MTIDDDQIKCCCQDLYGSMSLHANGHQVVTMGEDKLNTVISSVGNAYKLPHLLKGKVEQSLLLSNALKPNKMEEMKLNILQGSTILEVVLRIKPEEAGNVLTVQDLVEEVERLTGLKRDRQKLSHQGQIIQTVTKRDWNRPLKELGLKDGHRLKMHDNWSDTGMCELEKLQKALNEAQRGMDSTMHRVNELRLNKAMESEERTKRYHRLSQELETCVANLKLLRSQISHVKVLQVNEAKAILLQQAMTASIAQRLEHSQSILYTLNQAYILMHVSAVPNRLTSSHFV